MVSACLLWCIMYIRRGRASYPRRKKRRRRYLLGLGDVTAWRKSWKALTGTNLKWGKKKSGKFILGAFTFYRPKKVHLWLHWAKVLSPLISLVFLFSIFHLPRSFEFESWDMSQSLWSYFEKKFWASIFETWSLLSKNLFILWAVDLEIRLKYLKINCRKKKILSIPKT